MSLRRCLAVVVFVGWLMAAVLPVGAQSTSFDTSGLPNPPTTFEEQKLWDSIKTAAAYPELAPDAHGALAAYYDKRGLATLAAKERAATGGTGAPNPPTAPTAAPTAAPPTTVPMAQPNPPAGLATPHSSAAPAAEAESDDELANPSLFDLSAFPPAPTNFEEQLILESLQDPNTMTNPVLLSFAHRQLGRYYAAQGRVDLAATEYARAIVADPQDHRGYDGLAALHETAGTNAGDGSVELRDVAVKLQEGGYSSEGPDEAEPMVDQPVDAGQWQETSAEFNRRMNYLYTSNAWSNVYRTVFTNLYGR